MQNLILDKLPTPVLLVWGLPEDAHDSLMFMGGRILTYDTSAKTVAIRLSRRHDEYWQLIGKLSELTEEIIATFVEGNPASDTFCMSIEASGHYLANPINEPEFMRGEYDGGYDEEWVREWQSAQEKTLPANTLIFKKL